MNIFNFKHAESGKYIKYQLYIFKIKISFKFLNPSFIKFIFQYQKYLKKLEKYNDTPKPENLKKRLFITSGNLSLINNIAIINQLNLTDGENNLLIWSHMGSDEFKKINRQIGKFKNFKRTFEFCNTELIDLYSFFIKNYIFDFDEVYFPNCKYMFEAVNILFPYSKYYVTDEGVCTIVEHKGVDYSNVKNLIFFNYLDKFDVLNLKEENKEKLIFINKNEFKKIADKCEQLYPIDINLNSEDKNIIFCATLANLGIWSFSEILNYQNSITEKLIKKGYKIIFKPHPRDTYKYSENENFKVLKTRLPLECYNLKDKCLAIVSLFSSTSCQMYDYQKIAAFSANNLIKDAPDIGINMIEQYCPSVDMLLEIDTENKTFNELRDEILNMYENWINKKPLLSKNMYLINKYKSYKACPQDRYLSKLQLHKFASRRNIPAMLSSKKLKNYWGVMNYKTIK